MLTGTVKALALVTALVCLGSVGSVTSPVEAQTTDQNAAGAGLAQATQDQAEDPDAAAPDAGADAAAPAAPAAPAANDAPAAPAANDATAPAAAPEAPAAAAAPATPAGPAPAAVDVDGLLNSHNGFRARHGAPALTWSPSLAAAAQVWANRCQFAHDSNSGAGENINWGGGNSQGVVASWYNEVANYNFAAPGFAMNTGHFTQVVWKGSRQLGCGVATGCAGFAPGQMFWVCRYLPGGNMQGDFPNNVAPAAQ